MPSGREHQLVALVILDGWGCAPAGPGNAVELAETPNFDRLWRTFPHTTLEASGGAVGLPPGQMGNSEVGHLTIGSGRVLFQDLMRVNKAIEDGSFFENPALTAAFERGERVHLLGLVSHGGVHSHIDHLRALLRFAPEKTWIHAFTDGRDVSPHSAEHDLAELPVDRISTVTGRYYAMDRDGRWERTQRAFDAIVEGKGEEASDPIEAVRRSYERGITDEFIEPITIAGRPRLRPGKDTAIFFNFRPDRARQLSMKLVEAGADITTMTKYRVGPRRPRCASRAGSAGDPGRGAVRARGAAAARRRDREVRARDLLLQRRPRSRSGRGRPGSSCLRRATSRATTRSPRCRRARPPRRFVEELDRDGYRFAVLNLANPDMVGHTGSIPAAVKAVETADECLGEIVEAVSRNGGVALITADHGNAEQMLEADGVSPHTAHTTNPVPLIVTDPEVTLADTGELSDLSPTVLGFLGLRQPLQMTGKPLTIPD